MYKSLILFLLLTTFSCKNKTYNEGELNDIYTAAVNYIIASTEFKEVQRLANSNNFMVSPSLDVFSSKRTPVNIDSIFGDLNATEMESEINNSNDLKTYPYLNTLSTTKKSKIIISFTKTNYNFLIGTVFIAEKNMDYDSLLKGDFPDSCQEWIFVFTFENKKIKDVFETARNC